MSQNRKSKSSGSDKIYGSFPVATRSHRGELSRHRSDARGALAASLVLQSDMDKVMELNYTIKSKLVLRSVLRNESLRPFTQLNEQTR